MLTGAEITRATLLIFSGHAVVTMGDSVRELDGYHVLPAEAGRKQAFLALADTDLTMLLQPTPATSRTAEGQFTTEPERLDVPRPGRHQHRDHNGGLTMSGATTAAYVIGGAMLAGTAYSAYAGNKANQDQRSAQRASLAQADASAKAADEATNKANQKRPEFRGPQAGCAGAAQRR